MEKLLYPLWKPADTSGDDFRDSLLQGCTAQLAALPEIRGLRLAVSDSAVEAAAHRRMQSSASVPDALLSLWVDDAGARGHWEPLIAQGAARHSCYLVAEAEPLVSASTHPVAAGERLPGMCNVVFMHRLEGQSYDDWQALWKDSHTPVAIETQSTFGYRQNLVVRALGADTAAVDAIVEENFPAEAMSSDHAFYDTGGDEQLLQQRMTAMIESCARFIDFARIDVLPMSEYPLQPLG